MAFNLEAFREAFRPWAFTAGGRTYLARHVSVPECQRFDQMLEDATGDRRRQTAALRWILRRAFPWRLTYLTRGDPVRIILERLEPIARAEALQDFFACLRGEIPTDPQQKTNGTRSRGPTPRRTA